MRSDSLVERYTFYRLREYHWTICAVLLSALRPLEVSELKKQKAVPELRKWKVKYK